MEKYINIPYSLHGRDFDGCDCWGLVRLIYKHHLGIELPSYSENYISLQESEEIKCLFDKEKSLIWTEVNDPKKYDCVVLRTTSVHIGVVLENNYFIHILENTNSTIERINSPLWKNRIMGYYRYGK